MGHENPGFDFEASLQAVDWPSTPLGPREHWPRSLHTLLALIRRNKRPQYLVWGPDFRFFYNEGFLPVIGAKHPQGFGQPMAQVWPEVWHEIGPLVASCYAGEHHYFVDRPFVLRRHGFDELTYFSFSYTPAEDDSGTIAGLVCALAERTDEVADEERRRRELRRLHRLFEQAPGFCCVTLGREHVFALVNEAYSLLVGRPGAVLLGQALGTALAEIEGQPMFALLDQVFDSGTPFVGRAMPVRLARSNADDDELLYVDFVLQPIRDDDEQVIGIFTQGADVTDRVVAEAGLRASEKILRASNERKDRFLATLGHELRNPLAPIRTAAELLRGCVLADARAAQCVEVIARQSRHLNSLVEDIVDVARVANGLLTLKREQVDLNQVVVTAVEQLRPQSAELRHEVNTHLSAHPAWVHGDSTRLTQVLANLLGNAIRYTPPGGTITILVSNDPGAVQVRVLDNGIGIDAAEIPGLFEPFVQATRSSERSGGGLGIGLPLAKALVDAHGGSIRLTSDGPGCGSEVLVRLPCTIGGEAQRGAGLEGRQAPA